MRVTAETLFHFTTSLKNLEGILSKKFKLSYCKEEYNLDYETHNSYYPMISFCDIPLSLASEHIRKYGSFGIGMTKEWGIRNKLNPVLHLEKGSLITKDIQDTMDSIVKLLESVTTILEKTRNSLPNVSNRTEKKEIIKAIENLISQMEDYPELISHSKNTGNTFINIYRYIKNYQGSLIRSGKTIRDYKFYDEREWRYVPALTDKTVRRWLTEEQYKNFRGDGPNKPLIDNITLSFSIEDIKYLIVKSKKEIPKLIKSIRKIDDLAKNPNEPDILTAKILTIEQLNNDF
jgi:hypothetical protein